MAAATLAKACAISSLLLALTSIAVLPAPSAALSHWAQTFLSTSSPTVMSARLRHGVLLSRLIARLTEPPLERLSEPSVSATSHLGVFGSSARRAPICSAPCATAS